MKTKKNIEHQNMSAPICIYCGSRTYMTSFRYIKYGKNKKRQKGDNRIIYRCPKCLHYVNTHHKTNKAMGFPGDKELRIWRIYTHKIFDELWQKKIKKSRDKAYIWLARMLNIDIKDCHMAMFDIEQCKSIIDICIKEMAQKKEL